MTAVCPRQPKPCCSSLRGQATQEALVVGQGVAAIGRSWLQPAALAVAPVLLMPPQGCLAQASGGCRRLIAAAACPCICQRRSGRLQVFAKRQLSDGVQVTCKGGQRAQSWKHEVAVTTLNRWDVQQTAVLAVCDPTRHSTTTHQSRWPALCRPAGLGPGSQARCLLAAGRAGDSTGATARQRLRKSKVERHHQGRIRANQNVPALLMAPVPLPPSRHPQSHAGARLRGAGDSTPAACTWEQRKSAPTCSLREVCAGPALCVSHLMLEGPQCTLHTLLVTLRDLGSIKAQRAYHLQRFQSNRWTASTRARCRQTQQEEAVCIP